MKISKLFHWLYAILMLLPFAFFVPSILYYAFNDNSTMQAVEVPKTETILVDFNQLVTADDFSDTYYGINVTKTDYYISFNGTATGQGVFVTLFDIDVLNGHQYYFRKFSGGSINDYNFYILTSSHGSSETYSSSFIYTASFDDTASFRAVLSRSGLLSYDMGFYFNAFDLTQMFGSGNEPTIAEFDLMFTHNYYEYTLSQPMQFTYDTGETEQLVSNTDIINYAWESIWDLPLFNWCKVSFVSVPFTYISGLFGLAASNSFNYVFTYFASMSIIWLVFDVIMYVPLLVHRWLDKGIVE